MKLKIDIDKRWSDGVPHHPSAERLAKLIRDIDVKYNDDSMGWKFGGDGDNGEDLLYILSEIFERGLWKL